MTRRQEMVERFRSLDTLLIAGALVVAATYAAALGGDSLTITVTDGLAFLIFALGFYVFSGISGVISFGHIAFAAVGGYVAAALRTPEDVKETLLPNLPGLLDRTIDPVFATLAAGGIAALVGLILAVPLMRLSGLAAGLATVALLFVAQTVAIGWEDVTRGPRGNSAVPITADRETMLLWAIACLVIVFIYQRSRFGVRLRASSQDVEAASAIGVNVSAERGLAFVLSAFVTGVGGALYVQFLGSVTPTLFFIEITFIVVAMVVIGGLSSLSGTVIGVLLLQTVTEILRRAEAGSLFGIDIPERRGLTNMGIALFLILVLWLRRDGLTGGREIRFPRRRKPALVGSGAEPGPERETPPDDSTTPPPPEAERRVT